MSTRSEIVRLEQSQIGPAAAILGRAFQDDPLMLYTIPDAAERARMLPEFYARMLRFGVLAGEVYTTAGATEAVALWLPPGVQWTRERVQAAGLHELSSVIGADAIARFREVVGHEAFARERDMTEPYWYLLLLGVEPALQRRGLGGELIRPTIERAHREGVPCYVETEQPRNVAFYRRQGFELIVDGQAAGSTGVRFWTFHQGAKR